MKKGYDVIIIGGGIIGCATAFELAKRGITDVLLIEKRFLTSGASGRCGAGIRQQWGSELNARIALESTNIFEHLEEYTGYSRNCGLHQGGYLLVAYTEKEWDQFQKNLEVQHKLGIDSYAVDIPQIKEICPGINTEGMYGGTFCQKDGHADPFQCTQAYATGAARMGVKFLTYTEVTGLLTEGGKITGVETTRGNFEAKTVINCANVHAPELAKMVGEDVPVISERHQALITEKYAPVLDCMVMSFVKSYYVQQEPNGSFLMGIGTKNEDPSFNFKSSWQFLEENCAVMCDALPFLRKTKVIRQWAGQYDMSPDCNPVIDEAAEAKGFWTVCGFSGHGFMVAPRIGILMANKIAGMDDSMDIAMFSKERFKTGKLLLEPAVV
ncbi:NAD(P)/FAD-dependent oxidoreductase [Clostridium vitabionis]|jgi:sarcosine oxidase subunit beta|uniref:NAD(P)/FAD-dependent oxidoreductase n=1 Tax=Clostridium vitabionis TaxID=2784388 RepID=UPI00188B3F89|nr:FAD-binding oxidoreductase [Clostridium vitabionis]